MKLDTTGRWPIYGITAAHLTFFVWWANALFSTITPHVPDDSTIPIKIQTTLERNGPIVATSPALSGGTSRHTLRVADPVQRELLAINSAVNATAADASAPAPSSVSVENYTEAHSAYLDQFQLNFVKNLEQRGNTISTPSANPSQKLQVIFQISFAQPVPTVTLKVSSGDLAIDDLALASAKQAISSMAGDLDRDTPLLLEMAVELEITR